MTVKSDKKHLWPAWLLAAFFTATVVFVLWNVQRWKAKPYKNVIKNARKQARRRFSRIDKINPEENAWTYYRQAAAQVDFTHIPKEIKGKLKKGRVSPYKVLEYINNNAPDGHVPVAADLKPMIKANEKVLRYAGRGFEQKHFHAGSRDYNLVKEPGFDGKRLGVFLVLAGDYYAVQGRPVDAAKRYLQAVHLDNGFMKPISLVFRDWKRWAAVERIALKRLALLLLNNKNNPVLARFVYNGLSRIKRVGFVEMCNLQLVMFERYTDRRIKSYKKAETTAGKMFFIPEARDDKILLRKHVDGMIKAHKKGCLHLISKAREYPPTLEMAGGVSHIASGRVFVRLFYRRECLNNAVITLCLLNRHYNEKGRFPKNVTALDRAFNINAPVDPFAKDGKFEYEYGGGQIILYSTGFNGVDDGGDEKKDVVISPTGITGSSGDTN